MVFVGGEGRGEHYVRRLEKIHEGRCRRSGRVQGMMRQSWVGVIRLDGHVIRLDGHVIMMDGHVIMLGGHVIMLDCY